MDRQTISGDKFTRIVLGNDQERTIVTQKLVGVLNPALSAVLGDILRQRQELALEVQALRLKCQEKKT